MKKFNLLLTAVMAMVCQSNAQTTNVGIHAGPVFANTVLNYDGEKPDVKLSPGIYTGVFLDIPVSKKLTIQSGVNYVQKGNIVKDEFNGADYKATMRLHYIEVPVNVVWYSDVKQRGFYFGAGPAMAFGLSGKIKYKIGDEEDSEKMTFGTHEDDSMKGADLTANITTGYTFDNGFTMGAVANFGVLNLSTSDFLQVHNNYYGLKVGYIFRKKSK